MKKQNLPPFEELIERLYNSVVLRHPNEEHGEKLLEKLRNGWNGRHKELYQTVKQLEINEHKVNVIEQKIEIRDNTFQIGVDCLGFPIYVQHIVKFETITRDPKRYKKKGSDFTQIQTKATQVEFKEGNRLKQVLIFK